MFITKKQHNKIVNDYYLKILKLEKELAEAKDLKSILEKMSDLTVKNDNFMRMSGLSEIVLPDNVLVYEKDILGGKVIKQEATKCLIISEDGKVTEGLTAQKPDKNYTYKLIRE